MELQSDPLKEVLGELFALLEAQETQNAAVLQLLKDQGIATEEKLAPYLEQAGNGSNVKWRAARKRMEYLLTPIQSAVPHGAKEIDRNKEEAAEQNNTKIVSPEPAASRAAHQHQGQESQKTETASTETAPSGNGTPKADNAASENPARSAARKQNS